MSVDDEWHSFAKIGPLRVGHHRLNENDRAFVFRVGRVRPGRNGIHGVWEPIGGRADWNIEFGHILMMSGRVVDPQTGGASSPSQPGATRSATACSSTTK